MKREALLLATFVCSTMTYAQHRTAVAIPDSTQMVHLQEVQVVSTRAGKKTPMAYENISKDQLKKQNFGQDIPFLLSLTPSVVTTSDAGNGIGYTSIHIRGTDPGRINVTTNGIPINDADEGSVYWVNMPDLASSVDNMQVQRGVGTSTNGAAAFGATVNMQTEELSYKPFTSLDGSYGSYNSHKETFKFGTGLLKDHWAFQGRLSNIGSDGYIDRASTKLNSYFLQGGYFNNNTEIKFITFNGQERTYHAWDYASKAQMEEYGRRYNPCGEYTAADGTTAYYKNQIDFYHQQHYQMLWNQILTNHLNLNVALHYTRGFGYYEEYKPGENLYEYLLTSSIGDGTSDLVRRKEMENNFYGTVFSLNYNYKKLNASFGGGWNEYDGKHYGDVIWVKNFSGALDPDHQYYHNNVTKKDGNIYAKVNYEFIKGLNGYVDLQYRRLDYKITGPTDSFTSNSKGGYDQVSFDIHTHFNFFNPKAGLYWTISPNNTIYGSFAVAHKEPTRDDYQNSLGTLLPKAESLNDWEAGYKYNGTIFSAGANFYYMHYNNQLVLTGQQDAIGSPISKNVGKSYREGIELTAALKPCKDFRWDANATFSRNRAKDWHVVLDDTQESINLGNTHLSYSPDLIFNNIFSYNHKGFEASLQTQYVGKQYMTNTSIKSYTDNGKEVSLMLDAYCVSNLNLAYTFKLPNVKSVTLGVTIYNLFSEKYESNGSANVQFKSDGKNGAIAYQDGDGDSYSAYSAQAPINFMAHASFNF